MIVPVKYVEKSLKNWVKYNIKNKTTTTTKNQ